MENSIIVRNLPNGTYVPELCEHFRCFGNILSATIQSDYKTQSIGEAYIEFDDKYSALKAAKKMNNYRWKNKSLYVVLSVENSHFKQVFVKNLNPTWDECDLLKAFDHVGCIETVKISQDNGKSNGYGFLVFSNHTTAKRAVECMNGKKVDGRELIVERFKNKSERDSWMQNSLEQVEKLLQKSIQFNNLYIKNLPADIAENNLAKLFERYGEITSVKIAVDENGVSRQFGFVSFKNKEDAGKALKRMNGYFLKGKQLQISFKEDGQLRKQYNTLKNKESEIKVKQYRQRAKSLPKFMPNCLNYTGHQGNF